MGRKMAKVNVIYASFPFRDISATAHGICITERLFQFTPKVITGSDMASLEVATEQGVKNIGGALGWGVVGGVIAGPIGAVAGAVLGGNHRQTTFTLTTNDSRKLIGTVETGIFNALVSEKMKFDALKAPLFDPEEYERAKGEVFPGGVTFDDLGSMSPEEFAAYGEKISSMSDEEFAAFTYRK